MRPHSSYYNRKLSGSYSRKAQKQKKRFEERRKELGKPIEINSRRKKWGNYFPDYRKVSKRVESCLLNGSFTDRLEMQEYLSENGLTYPFRLVKRGLSDKAYSEMRRLPSIDKEARMKDVVGKYLFKQYGNILLKLAL